jgi:hypothetical protein
MNPEAKAGKLGRCPPHLPAILKVASPGLAHERHRHPLALPLGAVLRRFGYDRTDMPGRIQVLALPASTPAMGVAVMSAMCKCWPRATVGWLPRITAPVAPYTVRVSEVRASFSATHTETLSFSTRRRIGPASTRGRPASRSLIDCQAIIKTAVNG